MTTAHRPTWAPAKGHEEQGGARFYVASRMMSAKNMPSQLKMKFRKSGQAAPDEIRERDLRAELEFKEREHFNKGVDFAEERKKDLELLEAGTSAVDGGGGSKAAARPLVPKAVDADEEDGDQDVDASDSDSDDEDEEAALLAELERIKKERAEEARKKAQEEEAKSSKEKEKELMTGNPLLAIAGDMSFGIKRRWDEDVVFKNQTRNEPKQQKRFINDTIRNDFHKRFLQRYIR